MPKQTESQAAKQLINTAQLCLNLLEDFERLLNEFPDNPSNDDIEFYNQKMATAEASLDDYKRVCIQLSQDEISDLELLNYCQFENKQMRALAKAKGLIKKDMNQTDLNASKIKSEAGVANNLQQSLPRLSLPQFSGNFVDYLAFIDNFKSIVDQAKVSPSQKFFYLLSCVKDSARDLISCLPPTDTNYEIALGLLDERFNKPKLIIQSHIKNVFELKPVGKSTASLREFTDSLNKHVLCLRNMSISDEKVAGALFSHIVVSKLDPETKEKLKKEKPNEILGITEIIEFLQKRVQFLLDIDADNTMDETMDKNSTFRSFKDKSNAQHQWCSNAKHLSLVSNEEKIKIPMVTFSKKFMEIPKNIKLADRGFNQTSEVDILIGASHFYEILGSDKIKLGKNLPILMETQFGYVISGDIPSKLLKPVVPASVSLLCNDEMNLGVILNKLWEIENVRPNDPRSLLSVEERQCEHYFEETTVVDQMVTPEDRKFQSILWRENSTHPISTYVLNTITYGCKASTYLATKCLQYVALKNNVNYPPASLSILRDFYVDDYIHSGNDRDQVQQLIIEVTNLLGPLSPLSEDPNDFSPLTPMHFILGKGSSCLPNDVSLDAATNRPTQYQRRKQLVEHFWHRWSREVLPEMQRRSKWRTTSNESIQVGKLVLMENPNTKPLQWPLARIMELHPGKDGLVRVVTVQCGNGSKFKRAVTKLCVLPNC
ncbi:hypothetical protein PPYR_06459 [Photinus pyralis]|uniref:DUF5641 domain-containing protein n=1 Tax=Photinus pyralis TaxID=7054 RepID=A0A5N4AU28_PHOPY|nr:hypothetical protein PPYR_06459 [Photinus pyralis]